MVDARKLADVGEAIGKVAERFDALAERRRKDGYLSGESVPEDKTLRKTDSAAGNYAAQLKSAWEDFEAFDRVVAKLKADRSINTEGVREVVREVLGHEPRSKGRGEALQEMADWRRVTVRLNRRQEEYSAHDKPWGAGK